MVLPGAVRFCFFTAALASFFYHRSAASPLAFDRNEYRARDNTSDESFEIEDQCEDNEPVGLGVALVAGEPGSAHVGSLERAAGTSDFAELQQLGRGTPRRQIEVPCFGHRGSVETASPYVDVATRRRLFSLDTTCLALA